MNFEDTDEGTDLTPEQLHRQLSSFLPSRLPTGHPRNRYRGIMFRCFRQLLHLEAEAKKLTPVDAPQAPTS